MCGIAAAGLLAGCAGVSESKSADKEQNITSYSLSIAVRRGDFVGVKHHVDHHANVMETDSRGRTMLHLAVISGKLEIVQYLVEHGAEVNARDSTGKTPLHIAEALNRKTISDYLIEKGADPKIQDQDGRIPGELKNKKQMLRYSMPDDQADDPSRNRSKVSKKKWNRRKQQIKKTN